MQELGHVEPCSLSVSLTHLSLAIQALRSAWADDFYREVRSCAVSLGTNSAGVVDTQCNGNADEREFFCGFLLPEDSKK